MSALLVKFSKGMGWNQIVLDSQYSICERGGYSHLLDLFGGI